MKIKNITLSLLLFCAFAYSQNEYLNTDFGNGNGYTCFNVTGTARSMADIIKIGNDFYGLTSFTDYNLVKFSANGIPDATFGNNGVVHLDITSADAALYDYNNAFIKHTPDDNLLIIGNTFENAMFNFMVKTDLNGNPVTSFGNNGFVNTTWPDRINFLSADIVNNEIILTGTCYSFDPIVSSSYMVVMKYDLNGNPITSFGSNGVLAFSFNPESYSSFGIYDAAHNAIYAMVRQYIMTGESYEILSYMLKYSLTTNSIDTGFGTNGFLNIEAATNSFINPTVFWLDANETLYVAGATGPTTTNGQVFIKKYDANQEPDATFGTNGTSLYDVGDEGYEGVCSITKIDESITLSGYTHVNASNTEKLFLLRADTDGIIDASFGNSGTILGEAFTSTNIIPYKTIEDNGLFTVATISNQCNTEPKPTVIQFKPEVLGTSQNKLNAMAVYPNPVKDYLYINDAANITKAEVYDMSGKLLQQINNFESGKTDLSMLQPGVYIFKIYKESGIVNTKIIKT